MVELRVVGPYYSVLWEFLLAALPGAATLSSCLPLFKNKKGSGLFILGVILLQDACLFYLEGFLLNDFALVFSHPIVKDT